MATREKKWPVSLVTKQAVGLIALIEKANGIGSFELAETIVHTRHITISNTVSLQS